MAVHALDSGREAGRMSSHVTGKVESAGARCARSKGQYNMVFFY